LTALRSDEVIDLMIKEYPTKHAEYSVILQERERQRIAKEYSVIQVPQGRFKVLAPETTKTGPYPVALIPGQFQDYYKRTAPQGMHQMWRPRRVEEDIAIIPNPKTGHQHRAKTSATPTKPLQGTR
ncbi:hypothetical protein GOODEAATRI_017044, partial [Goodea atripinnis]